MKNSNMMPLLSELMNQNLTFDFNLNDSSNLTEIDNDYVQYQIYNEVRRNNSFIELWRHIFGISGCLISLFGIFGNILSIIILLKPASTNEQLTKYLNERNQSHHNRRSLGSFEHKLASFYAYLTALSFCDLFSCIFSILNMLEYIPPPYLDWSFNSEQYREFYLSISVYTHPIATTLQALSVWIVCAFSVHRCRSIINPSNYLSSSMKNGEKPTEASARNYFCRINLKNNCSHQTYELKFYTKAWQYLQHKLCLYCFCTFTPHYSVTTECDFTKPAYDVVHIVEPSEAEPERPIVRRPSQVVRTSTTIRKVNKARWVIFVLYVLALIYLIPQMFEKRLSYIEIHHKTYVFTTITEFGQQRWFRQIFHLWFYIIAIYIFPFFLILIFNLLLLRTYLISKKRVQRYKLRTDPNKILRDYNSNVGINGNINEELPRSSISMASKMNRANSSFCEVASTTTTTTVPLMCKQDQQLNQPLSNIQHRIQNFRRRSSARIASMKLDSKGRALTLTLLGVAIIFFICHFPAAIAKVIYVLYPRIEFEQKSRFASICLDISNFLIMVNSSINFLLYIVFGPGKFRQEFSLLCHRLFGRCGLVKHNTYKNSIVNFNTTNAEYSSCYRAGGGPKKCSITISENNFNMNTSRVANSIFESNERNDSGPLEELNV